MLDRWTPFTTSRWIFTVVLVIAFMARILIAQVRDIQDFHNQNINVFITGLVHRDICSGNLSSQLVARFPHPKDRPGHGGVRGGGGWSSSSNIQQRGVQTLHPQTSRVQVLVLRNQGNHYRLRLHLLRVLQYSRVLADPRDVLHHPLLYHHEKTN